MTTRLDFGWRIPDFNEDQSADRRGSAIRFRDQIFNFMDVIHGHFDTTWAGDHFFPWVSEMDQSTDTHEPWTILTYLMARYPQMRFGPTVLCQLNRSPALVAKEAAVLQLLSGGRLIMGIGAGWKEDESHAYGYNFQRPKVRLDQLEEAVQIIRKMWTEDAPTFHGKYYSIDNAYCSPRPDPVPPILIGGFGPKRTLKIVAQYADWSNIYDADLDFCKCRLDTLREHCKTVGRNYNTIVKTYICDCVALAPTHQKAETIMQASLFSQYQPMVGTPDELADQIQSYADLGFSHFMLRFADYPGTDGAKLFMQEVLPRFK